MACPSSCAMTEYARVYTPFTVNGGNPNGARSEPFVPLRMLITEPCASGGQAGKGKPISR